MGIGPGGACLAGLAVVPGPAGWSGGQDPGAAVAGQAASGQVLQVQRRGAALEPGVVLGHSAVAELDPAAAPGGDLGDDTLDVGPVGPVVLAQPGAGGPGGAGGAQQVMVRVQAEGPPGLGCRAPLAQRAGGAGGADDDSAAGVIGRMMPAGQVTAPACSSTVKSSTVNPPGTAAGSGPGLITAWCPAWPIASRRSPVP